MSPKHYVHNFCTYASLRPNAKRLFYFKNCPNIFIDEEDQFMKHFMTLNEFYDKELINLMELAIDYKGVNPQINQQLFAANLFFEASTRTKMSFMVAQKKLGLEMLDFNKDFSSVRSEEHTSELQSRFDLVCRLLLEKKKKKKIKRDQNRYKKN